MTEAAFWTSVRKVLVQSSRDDACRVENPAAPGTPDVHWCIGSDPRAVEGWLELKQVEGWPVRGGPLRVEHFTPQQRVWLTRRSRARGRCHLLIKVGRDWLLFEGRVAALYLGLAPREQLMSLALLHGSNTLDAEKLRNALVS